jgi:dynein heavy chain
MQQISKYDVAEIRTLQHPPKAIKLVLKAVCILLEVEPIVKKNKKNEWKPSYWRAATSEKVLGDPNLPQVLVTFDRNKLTTETMGLIEDILSEADYTYENAHFASKAATGLFRWVKAIRDYYYIFQEM